MPGQPWAPTPAYGPPIGVDGLGGEALDRRFTVDDQPVTLVSATGGRAVLRYGH